MKTPIDLGKPISRGESVSISDNDEGEKVYYPTLFLEWDESYDLPDSGTATIEFEVTSRTDDTKNGKYSVSIDVKKILSVKADKAAAKESPEDRLDRLKAEAEAEGETTDEESSDENKKASY